MGFILKSPTFRESSSNNPAILPSSPLPGEIITPTYVPPDPNNPYQSEYMELFPVDALKIEPFSSGIVMTGRLRFYKYDQNCYQHGSTPPSPAALGIPLPTGPADPSTGSPPCTCWKEPGPNIDFAHGYSFGPPPLVTVSSCKCSAECWKQIYGDADVGDPGATRLDAQGTSLLQWIFSWGYDDDPDGDHKGSVVFDAWSSNVPFGSY